MTEQFSGVRLRLARQLFSLTQRELGERVALVDAAIAYYESGSRTPKDDVVEAFADVLHVTPDFFFLPPSEPFREDQVNFRDQISATQRLRKRVVAYANFLGMAIERVRRDVDLPDRNLPRAPLDITPENAAAACRAHFGLGANAAIGRMSRVVETAGVVLSPLRLSADDVERVDALSAFGSEAVILVNTTKESVTRARFNMAHELGHAALHLDSSFRPHKVKEDEANRFAGAFLLPPDAFARDFRIHGQTVDGLAEMKRRWGVSIQAMLMRARELGLLNAAEIRVWFNRLSRKGWRRIEPGEPAAESEGPELLPAAIVAMGDSPAEVLARDLRWSPALLRFVTGVESREVIPDAPQVFSLRDYRLAKAGSEK